MPCAACLMLWQWSVQMHGMDFVAAIVDVHHYHVALAYHIHGDVGVEAAVDGPPHARPTFDEAWSATDPILELARGWTGSKPSGAAEPYVSRSSSAAGCGSTPTSAPGGPMITAVALDSCTLTALPL